MKKLILLLLLFPFFAVAQDDVYATKNDNKIKPSGIDTVPNTFFILKDNAIVYEKVFLTDLSKDDLKEKLKSFLPAVKSFQLTNDVNQSTDQYSGRLTDFVTNYRKYGGTAMGTSMALNYPLNGNVIIQVKDNKYRVIISDMLFKGINVGLYGTKVDVMLDDLLTRAKRSKIRSNSTSMDAAVYLSKDLTESFDISKSKKIETDF